MSRRPSLALALVLLAGHSAAFCTTGPGRAPATDFLVSPCRLPATLNTTTTDTNTTVFTLSNGLVARVFTLINRSPGSTHTLATTGLHLLPDSRTPPDSSNNLLHTTNPVAEAALTINNRSVLVGGVARPLARDSASDAVPDTPPLRFFFSPAHPPRTAAPLRRYAFSPGQRNNPPGRAWPPHGLRVEMDHFLPCSALVLPTAVAETGLVTATVAYELYEATTSMSKAVTLVHNCSFPLSVSSMTVAALNLVVDGSATMTTDSNVAVGEIATVDGVAGVHAVRFLSASAVDVAAARSAARGQPLLLHTLTRRPLPRANPAPSEFGPGLVNYSAAAAADPASRFTTFLVLETLHDVPRPDPATAPRGMGRYGRALSLMYRTVSPQTEEFPVLSEAVCTGGAALPSSDPRYGFDCYDMRGQKDLLTMLSQAGECGVDVVVVAQNMNSTWRSMLGVEFESAANISFTRSLVAHARSNNVSLGLYELLKNARSWSSLNTAAPQNAPMVGYDDMDPQLMQPCHNGHNPQCTGGPGCCSLCSATAFYRAMHDSVLDFWDATGISAVEPDGAESAQPCANTSHALHSGASDAIWQQWRMVQQTFQAFRARGAFNFGMPCHFLEGGQAKCPGGYDEMLWSQPRWVWLHRQRQRMIADPQNRDLFVPSVLRYYITPLTSYHPVEYINGTARPLPGRSSAADITSVATLEPLDEHLLEYSWALSQALTIGISSALRGFRLYQSQQSQQLLKAWTSFFHAHARLLITDSQTVAWTNATGCDAIVHGLSRASEEALYLSPAGPVRALLMVWNTLNATAQTTLSVPVEFSGLAEGDVAWIVEGVAPSPTTAVSRPSTVTNSTITVHATLGPLQIKYFLIQDTEGR